MSVSRAEYGKVVAPRRLNPVDFLNPGVFPFVISVLILFTIVSLFHVWSRVKVIDLSLEISESRRILKDAQQEKTRLSLEVASLKTPARIEDLARNELGMSVPTDQQVVVIK